MTGIVIANFPIIALIVAAVVGIPLWMTLRHPHGRPDYSEARAHYRAKAAAEAHTSDFVPTTRVAAFDGLTVARQHLAPRITVPGRRHATAGPSVRTHGQGARTQGSRTQGTPARVTQRPAPPTPGNPRCGGIHDLVQYDGGTAGDGELPPCRTSAAGG